MDNVSPDDSGFEKVEIPEDQETSRGRLSSASNKISPINISLLLEEIEDLRRKMRDQEQKLEQKTVKIETLKDENRLQKKELEKQYWELKHLRKENERLEQELKKKNDGKLVEDTVLKLQITQPDS
uniref:JAKMIP_CC3 domain-containing protein n=1 Tax=Caenorhabditis tropicalis TaxID=1561998 RepID=A0A1I7TPL5_9PELO